MASDDFIEYDGYVVHKTDAAVLFFLQEDGEEVWFPLSAVELDSNETSLLVPYWLAKNKGLL